MATRVGIGFQLSASAAGMSQGINAGVVELQKLGLQAKRTSTDLRVLRNIEFSRIALTSIQAVSSAITQANRLLSGFVNESVAIGEEASKANVIFGESAQAIQEFARSSSDIGLSTRAALQATASFGNLFAAIRLNNEQATEYSLTLTRLAADLASFNNTSVEDAVQALGAALRGESEPIRRYGVLLSEATLKQTALANGFEVTAGALSPIIRAQAAYLTILQQTGNAQGDFQRTSDSLANQQRILSAEWDNLRAQIGTALQPAYRALVAAFRESLPTIRDAGVSLAEFISRIDFSAVISGAVSALQSLGGVFVVLVNAAAPLGRIILPTIGASLAFINRQALAAGISTLGSVFARAAFAVRFYGSAARAAAVATAVLGGSIRTLVASTGVGALALVLGFAASAALEWAVTTRSAASQASEAVAGVAADVGQIESQFNRATSSATRFNAKAKEALQLPTLNAADVTQSALTDARGAVETLARELGGLANVSPSVLADFSEIVVRAQQANEAIFDQRIQLAEVQQAADRFTNQLRQQAELQKENAEAAKRTAEEVRRAAQQAQGRTQELAVQGLSGAEQSRLKLNQDLAAIALEQVNAERALAAARQAGDQQAIAAARERLRAVQQAAQVAKEQDRERRLDALGINRSLFDAVKSVRDVVRELRQAFDEGLIDPGQLRNAIRNIAEEGVKIQRDIQAELRRPNEQALRIADIRSGEGLSQFLQAQRRDPALDQREQQLGTLREIREILRQNNIRVAELV